MYASSANLPNNMGGYNDALDTMLMHNKACFDKGRLNMAGGCCGLTPPHLKAIREMASNYKPCKLPDLGLRSGESCFKVVWILLLTMHNQ